MSRNTGFKAANLKGADLSFSDMRNMDLAGTDLTGTILLGANVAGSDLSQSIGLTQGQVDVMVCVYDSSDVDGVSRQLKAISDKNGLDLDIGSILDWVPYVSRNACPGRK